MWWLTAAVVVTASITDLRSRRIPNWLVLPFLAAGLVMSAARSGWTGFGSSVGGIALATVFLGGPVWLGGMGMGDLKLCAAIGAWVGPSQLTIALVIMGITGGVMALIASSIRGSLDESLDRVNNLIFRFGCSRPLPAPPTLKDSGARPLPYAPAIAIGTLFSFFAR